MEVEDFIWSPSFGDYPKRWYKNKHLLPNVLMNERWACSHLLEEKYRPLGCVLSLFSNYCLVINRFERGRGDNAS